MDLLEMLTAFGWLFCCCLGMAQQEHDIRQDWKQNFNIAHSLFVMHQRAIVVTCRNRWGRQALGWPCFFALVLMLGWNACAHDNFMLLWVGFWSLCLMKRRFEALRMKNQIHSQYDGWPINLGSNERNAKLIYEPILCGILGGFLFWLYTENGLRPTGLPYFILAGTVSLPFIEAVKQTMWDRRMQAMQDAKMEQEMAVRDFHDRFGN